MIKGVGHRDEAPMVAQMREEEANTDQEALTKSALVFPRNPWSAVVRGSVPLEEVRTQNPVTGISAQATRVLTGAGELPPGLSTSILASPPA